MTSNPVTDSATPRWPYTEPHICATRWKVDLPAGPLKGIGEDDARELAEDEGGTAYRSTMLLITGGPDKGTAVLGPWRPLVGRSPAGQATAEPTERPTAEPTGRRELVHHCPPPGQALTPCCRRSPFDLLSTDRMSVDESAVTCGRTES